MRGEKAPVNSRECIHAGSPPHARGKVNLHVHAGLRVGITPACAGKRTDLPAARTARRDHPRMRGEKKEGTLGEFSLSGSPPHARGKDSRRDRLLVPIGITPACAGKSHNVHNMVHYHWDHPRMRGEKGNYSQSLNHGLGSPPHARGKELDDQDAVSGRGITPACAGKSTSPACPQPRSHSQATPASHFRP